MYSWIDEQIARQRHADIVREERHRRMIEIVLEARQREVVQRRRFYSPMLASVGRRLVAWGCSLEARYGPIVEAHTVTNAGGRTSSC